MISTSFSECRKVKLSTVWFLWLFSTLFFILVLIEYILKKIFRHQDIVRGTEQMTLPSQNHATVCNFRRAGWTLWLVQFKALGELAELWGEKMGEKKEEEEGNEERGDKERRREKGRKGEREERRKERRRRRRMEGGNKEYIKREENRNMETVPERGREGGYTHKRVCVCL